MSRYGAILPTSGGLTGSGPVEETLELVGYLSAPQRTVQEPLRDSPLAERLRQHCHWRGLRSIVQSN